MVGGGRKKSRSTDWSPRPLGWINVNIKRKTTYDLSTKHYFLPRMIDEFEGLESMFSTMVFSHV